MLIIKLFVSCIVFVVIGHQIQCVQLLDDKPTRSICQYNEDCPPNELCDRLNRICINPCFEDSCGENAECVPENYKAICRCPQGTKGNPHILCTAEVGKTLCSPGPCGPNSNCAITGNTEKCLCKRGFQGDPYATCHPMRYDPCNPNPCGPYTTCTVSQQGQPLCNCAPGTQLDSNGRCARSTCTIDDDCPNHKACVSYKCIDPCLGSCGIGASCHVERHHPVCTCKQSLAGNPLTRCYRFEITVEPNPCQPYPCGPNTYCEVFDNRPVCSCIQGLIGDPRLGCKPECVLNTDCGSDRVCANYQCKDPCSIKNVCGLDAECLCRNHTPTCICSKGFTGNPFIQCLPESIYPSYQNRTSPCASSPCGTTNSCHVQGNGVAICNPCAGPNGYNNPACRPECLCNADCAFHLACLGQKCLDPCVGACGINAQCTVVNHSPICSCPETLTGNPYELCSPIRTPPAPTHHYCNRGCCGANAICKYNYGRITCECMHGYFGNPYLACRPECVINTHCPQTKACLNNKCMNPCSGVCGKNSECRVINHQPMCYCPQGFTGNPFRNCYPHYLPLPPVSPCDPSPCGANSRCLVSPQGYAVCSCLPGYLGLPPYCKPECVVSTECPSTQCCINQTCSDPCITTCGVGAQCFVINHSPICSCPPGYTGNPFSRCILPPVIPTEKPDLCNPSPCGSNAVCKERNGAGSCQCLPGYSGDPHICCKPECVLNSECPDDKTCVDNKCINPCPGVCGTNAKCWVINHTPSCSCTTGYTGNPLVACHPTPTPTPYQPTDPCIPTPCGPYSVCRQIDSHAACACQKNYIGSPPNCRLECTVNSECLQNKACIEQKCTDPCPGHCGQNARCQVVNHSPICSCPSGYTGDPFVRCIVEQYTTTEKLPENPCVPSPCGPHSECRVINYGPACSCLSNYTGKPPNCRPECVTNADCQSHLTCKNAKCTDPCPGSCSQFAQCQATNHTAICICPPGYMGDAAVECYPEPTTTTKPINPCYPNPCGLNAECISKKEVAACRCYTGYFGDPYIGCKRECETNTDCHPTSACIGYKCIDPCPGKCGSDAVCAVVNHLPTCSCPPEYTGNPFSQCRPIPSTEKPPTKDPCNPSPCGPNSQCQAISQQANCACLPTYVGSPPNCRPECVNNSECELNKACKMQKCVDPCPSICGLSSLCDVRNHIPYCSCPPQYTGNPFIQCSPIPPDTTVPPTTPRPSCEPSPCGPHSQCVVVNDSPVCSCLPEFVGSPPYCHIECVTNSECGSQLTCINQHCKDPCPGSCGFNANCSVINHVPVCKCPPNYRGNPEVECEPALGCDRADDCPDHLYCINHTCENPCEGKICGVNAYCDAVNHQSECKCPPNHQGNPEVECEPPIRCDNNDNCPDHLHCINQICENPCAGQICGVNAYCNATNHQPVCKCPPNYQGNPEIECDLPKPKITPKCLSDGIQIEMEVTEPYFNGIMYVKGHSNEEECSRLISVHQNASSHTEVFKVPFGSCGLIHTNNQANFILVLQNHPKLATFKTQAYHIKCAYGASEKNFSVGYHVSVTSTAGTIANQGPAPICVMKVVTSTGQETQSAEIGEDLILQVDVQPSNVYGGFARSCKAKSPNQEDYNVTDEYGCATDPSIFSEWEYNKDTHLLTAKFSAFKFPNSDDLTFQCKIRVCLGQCQPVNCGGYNAFGRRRKRQISDGIDIDILHKGQIQEEKIIESNAIVAVEKLNIPIKAERQTAPSNDVCISMIGLIISIIITGVLALTAVAVMVSWWLMANSRTPPRRGPMAHPAEIPNPMYTSSPL
ncbi:neurogenic locus notch homolog protein 1-like [Planococcus citri]|uniref:neurogenic locus notch homolog protein 1-like n=1 Tax=Planococcus citri TaxID=170843 RepID=UPI0031F9F821